MKPNPDPTSDSLISGINPPLANTPPAASGIPDVQEPIDLPINPQPQPATPFQNPSGAFDSVQTENMNATNPSFQTQPVQNVGSPFQTAPPSPIQTIEAPPSQSPVFQPPTPIQQQTAPQNTSPLDPPPAPPQIVQQDPSPVNLESKVVNDRPKKKTPVFLFILLFLVIAVLGVVGYLAFQNQRLAGSITENPSQQTSLQTPALKDPYIGYIKYTSNILPIEFMLPSGWSVEESEDPSLANQKMITATSSDFSYEGGAIAQGFQFRVGPVNDLTKKYTSFDAFFAEENAEGSFTQKTINGKEWLVKETEAMTLIDNSPVTIALYANISGAATSSEVFGKILNSIKITAVPPTPEAASPSAAVSE